MPKKTRRGIEYPKKFMKDLKKQKRKRIRQTPIDEEVSKHNNADMEI